MASTRPRPPRAQQHQLAVDPHLAQQREHQRGLVLAVAEAARQHLADPVGLVAVDAELQRRRSGCSRARTGAPRAPCPAVLRARRWPRRRRATRFSSAGQLVLHQAPVPAPHLLPARVGADVQVGRDLGPAGHARLGHHPGDVVGGEACTRISPPRFSSPVLQPRQRRAVEVELAPGRPDQDVLASARAARSRPTKLDVAEVAGQRVLEETSRRVYWISSTSPGSQPLEHHHLGAQVVVEAVPGLGQIAIVAARPPRAPRCRRRPRVGRCARAGSPPPACRACSGRLDSSASRAACSVRTCTSRCTNRSDEPVAVHAHHLLVQQHDGAARRRARGAGPCPRSAGRASASPSSVSERAQSPPVSWRPRRQLGLEPGQVPAQRRVLRPQRQRLAQLRRSPRWCPGPHQQPPQLLVHARLVGQPQRPPSPAPAARPATSPAPPAGAPTRSR